MTVLAVCAGLSWLVFWLAGLWLGLSIGLKRGRRELVLTDARGFERGMRVVVSTDDGTSSARERLEET